MKENLWGGSARPPLPLVKTDDFYKNIANDVNARFDMSSYCQNHPLLPIEINKKVIGLMKDELGGRIMTEFVAFRPKLYTSEMFSGSRDKKCKEAHCEENAKLQ